MYPYLPTPAELRCIARGKYDTQSLTLTQLRRALVSSNTGLRWLSIPLEGGGRRRVAPEKMDDIMVSEHGNWRHVHLQAIASEYGRMPYFEHLYPLLEEALAPARKRLADINALVVDAMMRIGIPGGGIGECRHEIAAEVTSEYRSAFPDIASNANASALPAVMLLGPRTALLMADFDN